MLVVSLFYFRTHALFDQDKGNNCDNDVIISEYGDEWTITKSILKIKLPVFSFCWYDRALIARKI